MAKPQYRKLFLQHLAASWARRFPEWQRGASRPVFYATPESTFSCSRLCTERGLFAHAVIDFSSKVPGSFTCDVIINDHEGEIAPNRLASAEDIPALRVGRYRIGYFMMGQDFWWHLREEPAESKLFRELLAQHAAGQAAPLLQQTDWYAPRYDLPLPEIISAAGDHFSTTFARCVLPRLGLEAPPA